MAIWHVDSEGCDDHSGRRYPFRTIQAALEHALPGDLVRVAGGSYNRFDTVRDGVTIEAEYGCRPYIGGEGEAGIWEPGPIIEHDHVTLKGFEVAWWKHGPCVHGGKFARLIDLDVHDLGGLGVRFRDYAVRGRLLDSRIYRTGRAEATSEAVYVGTSITQVGLDGLDETEHTLIEGCEMWDCSEAVNVKEGARFTVIQHNIGHHCTREPDGAFNIQGDDNVLINNQAHDCIGAGFRAGGGAKPDGSPHGIRNQYRRNVSLRNEWGFKWPAACELQDFDPASNIAADCRRG